MGQFAFLSKEMALFKIIFIFYLHALRIKLTFMSI
jgi:hypothetical protein